MTWAPLFLAVVMAALVLEEVQASVTEMMTELNDIQSEVNKLKSIQSYIQNDILPRLTELDEVSLLTQDDANLLVELLSKLKLQISQHRKNPDCCVHVGTDAVNQSIVALQEYWDDEWKKLSKMRTDVNCSQSCPTPKQLMSVSEPARSCQEHRQRGATRSGIFKLYLGDGGPDLQVYCDMVTESQGWIVFQRVEHGIENFTRGWRDYRDGFGYMEKDFWLGLNTLHRLTGARPMHLRVDIKIYMTKQSTAEYSHFTVSNEADFYRLLIGGYRGDAGDGFTYDSRTNISGMRFSTIDNVNDAAPLEYESCPSTYKAGWWYNFCHSAFPNGWRGRYGNEDWGSAIWPPATSGDPLSLRSIEMKLK